MTPKRTYCGEIISRARATLDLPVSGVLAALRNRGSPMSRRRYLEIESDQVEPRATEWFAICEVLFLGVDSLSTGYLEGLHRGRIAHAKGSKSSGSCRPR